MEEKILELLRLKMSIRYIREVTGATEYMIQRIRRENGFCKAPDAEILDNKKKTERIPAALCVEWDDVTRKLRRYFSHE